MTIIFTLLAAALVTGVVLLDVYKKTGVLHKLVINIFLIIVPHTAIILFLLIYASSRRHHSLLLQFLILLIGIFFAAYVWLKVNIAPYSGKEIGSSRMRVLMGGRRLILYSLYSVLAQIAVYIFAGRYLLKSTSFFIIDIVIVTAFIITMYTNGMLRVIFSSKRINIFKKIILAATMFIPPVSILGIIYSCRVAAAEYDHECYRVEDQRMRIESQACKTKYPLVLIHGVAFRDIKYINYWGRIPKELISQGATVYYGNQEAWGTVEYNAQEIKDKIHDIIAETGCEKVNIIAHSKGGLDARYMISKLDMGDRVASLTTICTPHRGSKVMDVVYRLPERLFQFAGRKVDKYYRVIGDKNPDFFTACRQLSTFYSKEFNEAVTDDKRVYYQSYAAAMKHPFSDYVLTVPYIILRLVGGENDGLVEVESAKWGEFKGVIRNRYSRGVSHGDIIDLRRSNYKGFDVRSHYVEIVSGLKERGY